MILITIVMTYGKIDGNAPTFYAHLTHLAGYSFVGYNITNTLNVMPLSLRIMSMVSK